MILPQRLEPSFYLERIGNGYGSEVLATPMKA